MCLDLIAIMGIIDIGGIRMEETWHRLSDLKAYQLLLYKSSRS